MADLERPPCVFQSPEDTALKSKTWVELKITPPYGSPKLQQAAPTMLMQGLGKEQDISHHAWGASSPGRPSWSL
jgi:hypothetical protein